MPEPAFDQIISNHMKPNQTNTMKMNQYRKLATIVASVSLGFAFQSFAEEEHDHGDHEGHDHAEHEGHDHGDDDHAKKVAGPNGGRVLTGVEPHLEFFVTKDRKVKVTAVDDDGKAVKMEEQSVSVIGGSRSNPTRMSFTKEGDSLVSDKAFPEGNNLPVVVQIKAKPDAKTVIEKFSLNLSDCPSCDYLEYACTCDHGGEEDDHEGHDH